MLTFISFYFMYLFFFFFCYFLSFYHTYEQLLVKSFFHLSKHFRDNAVHNENRKDVIEVEEVLQE